MRTLFDHMAVQTTLDRCGVVLMDRSQVRTAPGPQPQRVFLLLGQDGIERLVA